MRVLHSSLFVPRGDVPFSTRPTKLFVQSDLFYFSACPRIVRRRFVWRIFGAISLVAVASDDARFPRVFPPLRACAAGRVTQPCVRVTMPVRTAIVYALRAHSPFTLPARLGRGTTHSLPSLSLAVSLALMCVERLDFCVSSPAVGNHVSFFQRRGQIIYLFTHRLSTGPRKRSLRPSNRNEFIRFRTSSVSTRQRSECWCLEP